MNTEEFVTYEQAVKLKELGFDWACTHYYEKEVLTPAFDDQIIIRSFIPPSEIWRVSVDSLRDNYNDSFYDKLYSAPTLSQTAKWLREVKDIYVVVEPRFSNYKLIGYDWIVYDDCSGDYALRAPLPFSRTYESALSAGIDEALKLIKE